MKTDVILAGVGGQGVLSAAAILAETGLRQGLHVRQGELHGMAQRGGAVQASLRLSDEGIPSDLVPRGAATLLLSMEPLEALRYVDWLAPDGVVLAAAEAFENIPDYPSLDDVHARIRTLPDARLVEAGRLAREAGNARSANVAMIGAAMPFLPLDPTLLQRVIREAFAGRGPRVVEANVAAFLAGMDAVAPAAAVV